MKFAIANLQRLVFTVLLYSSAISGIACDIAGLENRSAIFAGFELMMLLLVVLSLSTIPRGYAMIVLLLLAAIGFNFVHSPISLAVSLNGSREMLLFILFPIFYYKIFAEGNEEESYKYLRLFRRFSWFFLLVQIPATLWQFMKFGASDMVGGTYGSGASGGVTIIILCLVFYMFQFPYPGWKKMMLLLLLAPLMLNETKISFILIPMMVMFIFFEPKAKNIIYAGIGGGLFLLIASQLYVHEQVNVGHSIFDIFNKDFLNDYLLSDTTTVDLNADLPRITRLIIGYNIIAHDTFTLLFGMEYGMFRGTTTGQVSLFARNYFWLLKGTRPYLFFVMMQGGLIMVGGVFLIMFKICNFFRHVNKQTVFYFLIFLIMLLYADSFRAHNFLIVYMFVLFFVNSDIFKTKAYLNEDIDSLY